MKEILSNGSMRSIAQAIEEMKAEQGESFSLENINLAELERRSGVSRGKLRRLKRNGFQDLPRATKGRKHTVTKPVSSGDDRLHRIFGLRSMRRTASRISGDRGLYGFFRGR